MADVRQTSTALESPLIRWQPGSLPKCLIYGKGIQSRQCSRSAFAAVDTFITRRRSRSLTGMKW
jgi:hypothetical protein